MIHPVHADISQPFGSNPTSKIYPGSPDYWIIQKFGNYQPNGHTGTDYAVKEGTPVRAVTAGQVLHAGTIGGTYADNPWWIAPNFAGVFVVIDHGSFISIYGHLKSGGLKVRAGDWVAEGQVIALSGNTGGSTGDHLHFEVMPDGWDFNNGMYGRVDPAIYLSSASLGPLGDILTNLPEGIELAFTIPELLNYPAYTGGPTVSQVLKNTDQRTNSLYDAMFNGGKSMPGGLPLKDLIANGQRDILSAVNSTGSDEEIAEQIAAAIPAALVTAVVQALNAKEAA